MSQIFNDDTNQAVDDSNAFSVGRDERVMNCVIELTLGGSRLVDEESNTKRSMVNERLKDT